MEENRQNRLKSWALWMALAALVVYVVKTAAGIDMGDKMCIRDSFLDDAEETRQGQSMEELVI